MLQDPARDAFARRPDMLKRNGDTLLEIFVDGHARRAPQSRKTAFGVDDLNGGLGQVIQNGLDIQGRIQFVADAKQSLDRGFRLLQLRHRLLQFGVAFAHAPFQFCIQALALTVEPGLVEIDRNMADEIFSQREGIQIQAAAGFRSHEGDRAESLRLRDQRDDHIRFDRGGRCRVVFGHLGD